MPDLDTARYFKWRFLLLSCRHVDHEPARAYDLGAGLHWNERFAPGRYDHAEQHDVEKSSPCIDRMLTR